MDGSPHLELLRLLELNGLQERRLFSLFLLDKLRLVDLVLYRNVPSLA